ncbi:MAG: PGF-pre-PGF domain-containing protein [Candidatus Aenigmatarchaeota archaeon]
MKLKLMFLLAILLIPNLVLASVSVEIIQPGADPGYVIAGQTFTVTASGWSGECNSATIDLSECGACSISESTTKSISGSSVSWTTLTATQSSAQKIKVSVSGLCTPDSGYITFGSKTAPSLSASVNPSSTSVTRGSTFTVSLNIQNSGETTARFGTITVSPSYFSISSGCSPSDITGGQSLGLTCTITTSSSTPTGTQTMSIYISPSNADSVTKTVSVSVSAPSVTTTTLGGGAAGGGVTGGGVPVGEITRLFAIASSDSPANWDTSSSNIGVIGITVNVVNTVKNFRLTLSKLSGRPSTISQDPTNNVYLYLELGKQNIEDANISFVTIRFKVNKTWVFDNNIDVNTISLYRYSNGWQKLTTTKTNEDNECYYFEAISPGLSTFAVAGEQIVVTTTTLPEVITTTTLPTTIPTTILVKPPTKPTNLYIIFLLLLLLVIVLMFLVIKRSKKKEKLSPPPKF